MFVGDRGMITDACDHKKVTSRTTSGQRLNIRRNAALAKERQRKRAALHAATREKLDAIAKSVARAINPRQPSKPLAGLKDCLK